MATSTFYDSSKSANKAVESYNYFDVDFCRGDSSNVSEEDLLYQLPAQVGSFAPILGEVLSANKAIELYFGFDSTEVL